MTIPITVIKNREMPSVNRGSYASLSCVLSILATNSSISPSYSDLLWGEPVRLVCAVNEFQVVKVVRFADSSSVVPGADLPLRLDETAVQNVAVAVVPPVEGIGAAIKPSF